MGRETVRDALVSLLVASGKFQSVYGYLTTDIQGKSPVACVSGMGSRRVFEDVYYAGEVHELAVAHFVRRDDPAAAEDKLDELEEVLSDVIETNANYGAVWKAAQRVEESVAGYEDIDGAQYRVELFAISVHVAP